MTFTGDQKTLEDWPNSLEDMCLNIPWNSPNPEIMGEVQNIPWNSPKNHIEK
jgi:hypothetical protein